MSQCVVPSWEVDHDNNPTASRLSLRSHSNSITAPDLPMLDYEVAELTWENGQISMHGLGFPRVPAKPFTVSLPATTRSTASTAPAKYTWEKPRAGGTLESIVNQASSLPPSRSKILFDAVCAGGGDGDDLVPWFHSHRTAAVASATAPSNTMTMDAMVPCSNRTDEQSTPLPGIGTRMVGSSTRVGSCSGCAAATHDEDAALLVEKRPSVARVPIAHEWSSWDQNHSMSGSATYGRDSQQMTLDTSDKEIGPVFTSTSNGSPENTTSAKQCTKTTTTDDHDSVCHSRSQRDGDDDEDDKKKGTGKSSVSTKRSRAAAIHNQSERKRRDKINQRMKTLQKLVPNSSKTDKASMLDEVIEYLKQLQAQVQMMSRMNLSPMMMPMAMPQQLQMSMMAPMGMGLGMGMGMGIGMDMNTMSRPNIPGMPPVLHPSAFMSMGSWDASGAAAADRMQRTPATVMPDPVSTFLACQSQPMTLEAYSRLAAMYQQLHQPPASSSKG